MGTRNLSSSSQEQRNLSPSTQVGQHNPRSPTDKSSERRVSHQGAEPQKPKKSKCSSPKSASSSAILLVNPNYRSLSPSPPPPPRMSPPRAMSPTDSFPPPPSNGTLKRMTSYRRYNCFTIFYCNNHFVRKNYHKKRIFVFLRDMILCVAPVTLCTSKRVQISCRDTIHCLAINLYTHR